MTDPVSPNAVSFRGVLMLADDALVLSHRLAEWCSHAPQIEEDIALTNLALDLLGQARNFLSLAGELEDLGRGEDALAYTRTEDEFLNALLVEHPNNDFAVTVIRQLLFSTYQLALYRRLGTADDERLAAIAAKGVKEAAYHLDHAQAWTLRLGDGTSDSRARTQAALERLWPYTHELFEDSEGAIVAYSQLREAWLRQVTSIIDEATLQLPADGWHPSGGRAGRHTEAFGYLIAETQHLHRSHPGVVW